MAQPRKGKSTYRGLVADDDPIRYTIAVGISSGAPALLHRVTKSRNPKTKFSRRPLQIPDQLKLIRPCFAARTFISDSSVTTAQRYFSRNSSNNQFLLPKLMFPVMSMIERTAANSDRQPFSCSMTSPHMATEPITQGNQ